MRVEFYSKVRDEDLPPPPRTEPFPSTQVFRPILCPFCGAARPRVLRSVGDRRYYACRACDMSGEPSFKVPVLPGDPALVRIAEQRKP